MKNFDAIEDIVKILRNHLSRDEEGLELLNSLVREIAAMEGQRQAYESLYKILRDTYPNHIFNQ